MSNIQPQSGIYKRDQLIRKITNLLIVECRTEQTVLQMLMDANGFNYSLSYAYELIRESRKQTAEIYAGWTINALELALADLSEQKEQAKKAGDRKLVRILTRDINEMKGLYIQKHQITITQIPRMYPDVSYTEHEEIKPLDVPKDNSSQQDS